MNNQLFRWGYVHLGNMKPDDMFLVDVLKRDMQTRSNEPEVVLLVGDALDGHRLVSEIAALLKASSCALVPERHTFVSLISFDDRPRCGFGELVYDTGEISLWPRVWSKRNGDFRMDNENTIDDSAYARDRLDWRRKKKQLEMFHHNWVEGRHDEALRRLA